MDRDHGSGPQADLSEHEHGCVRPTSWREQSAAKRGLAAEGEEKGGGVLTVLAQWQEGDRKVVAAPRGGTATAVFHEREPANGSRKDLGNKEGRLGKREEAQGGGKTRPEAGDEGRSSLLTAGNRFSVDEELG